MSRHTPGPWHAEQCGELWVMAGDLFLATIVDSDEEGELEADAERRLSNACLMAAAPDLAAALARLLAVPALQGDEPDEEETAAMAQARTALTKAGMPIDEGATS